MTQEEKQILFKVLCGMLPYGVKVEITILESNKVIVEEFDYMWFGILYSENPHHIIKPYLRPMSSMTEEEKEEVRLYFRKSIDELKGKPHEEQFILSFCQDAIILDWLNAHHFDYRGLIEKGLALEALEGMYKTE